ncbi:hypothetical protein [Solitalea canadensis]|uniref:Type II secretion system protein GspC N-terminal domain-containing protein n=1 Tax=Solitalea canadensis (strain ATCC 29591 / DSM 3403 / JCM 21819 / LMG 8368 / NBRC 15130 / NCIMB 12057 / USAM 9D) TaxID=929556 RepID=H8KTT6_SOLCM|nr:hypothetical protein [Solitalea canadensis]AFD06661.1 hypothetical protein Solca_1594 [Solitalea canadensis DSM 3403]
MKNKTTTYSLLVAVLFIWGYVFYKAIDSVAASDNTNHVAKPVKDRIAVPTITLMPDTFTLMANYRDPFLDKPYNEASIDTSKRNTISAPKPIKIEPYIDWSIIRYSGVIQNANSKQAIVLVNIRGKDYMMKEGATNDGVKLMKNQKDSIKVLFQGKSKFIRIN